MSQETVFEKKISCACPKCARRFRVPAALEGKKIICKGCQTHFLVQPVPEPTAPGAAAATGQAPAPPAARPDGSVSDFDPIPLDDIPVSGSAAPSAAGADSSAFRPATTEKLALDTDGHYAVVKVPASSKFGIEKILNEYAVEGWRLQQLFTAGNETYAIFFREPNALHDESATQTELAVNA